MKKMTRWDRVRAAIRGEEVDRVPFSLWKHYHLQDRAPGLLADVLLAFHQQFDTDFIKLMPSGLYPIQDWGATIRFGTDDNALPLAVQPVVASADDWERLPKLDVNKGALRRELEMIHRVARGLDGTAPCLMTIFNPLTIAYKLCGDRVSGDRVMEYLRQSPRKLHAGLATIRDVMLEYVDACVEAGASGIFFASKMTTYDTLTREEYEEFSAPYDLAILESLKRRSQITMMHLCQTNVMFDLTADYPVDLVNWDDRNGSPSLAEARRMTSIALAGGLSREVLLDGTEDEVMDEARDAIAHAGRTGFILAPACVVKGPSPDANLLAVRRAVEETTI
jgi:uroporphyrinogen decarboxylase